VLVETWGFNDDKRTRKVIEMSNNTKIKVVVFDGLKGGFREETVSNPSCKKSGGRKQYGKDIRNLIFNDIEKMFPNEFQKYGKTTSLIPQYYTEPMKKHLPIKGYTDKGHVVVHGDDCGKLRKNKHGLLWTRGIQCVRDVMVGNLVFVNIIREDKLGRLTYGDLTYKPKPMEESFMSVWV
jgi:hypothetical protein